MADEIDVVVKMTSKIIIDTFSGLPRVPDKFPFGHFVLDMWTTQIDRQHD